MPHRDIKKVELTTPEDCYESCAALEGCAAFTANTKTGKCYLKDETQEEEYEHEKKMKMDKGEILEWKGSQERECQRKKEI